jgi:hypothetical protein
MKDAENVPVEEVFPVAMGGSTWAIAPLSSFSESRGGAESVGMRAVEEDCSGSAEAC